MGGAYELITGLRATRWFTGEAVTEDEVTEIVEAARLVGFVPPWQARHAVALG
ncbi:hypothetical protein [Amycolatopsis acidicola]|uniref:hypothetical protein n=1 Tax=Amycolatopsis acidicola TaxID=2596893 RepID=UPI00140924FC|nr:hypothetical protein [Amycolatopsis acidicola]